MIRTARLVGVSAVCLLMLSAAAFAATPIGKVAAKRGSPTASGPNGERGLSEGSPVFEGDRIVTRSGNVQIIFIDNTKLVVGPNSRLVIDRFLLRGGNRAQKFSIDALRGTFRFISGRSPKNAYDIKTANATIGIRGTAFDFSSYRSTLVAMFDGSTILRSGGSSQILESNCEVGRASNNDVDELTGQVRARAVRSNLPYVLNQGTLSAQFRVNNSACRSVISQFQEREGDSNEGAEPGPPGPADDRSGYGD